MAAFLCGFLCPDEEPEASRPQPHRRAGTRDGIRSADSTAEGPTSHTFWGTEPQFWHQKCLHGKRLVITRKGFFPATFHLILGRGASFRWKKCLFHAWHFVSSEPTEGARPTVLGISLCPWIQDYSSFYTAFREGHLAAT